MNINLPYSLIKDNALKVKKVSCLTKSFFEEDKLITSYTSLFRNKGSIGLCPSKMQNFCGFDMFKVQNNI